jgi:hypothetical protein
MSEMTQGWHAAASCETFDETMPPAWQEGYRLWHTRQHYRALGHPPSPAIRTRPLKAVGPAAAVTAPGRA